VERFRDATFGDARIYAFHVDVRTSDEGPLVLSGYVEFVEIRDALVKCLHRLGFNELDDRIEILPSQELGPLKYGVFKTTHSLSLQEPQRGTEVVTDGVLGEAVFLLKKAANDFFLCHTAEGYLGFIESSAIQRMEEGEFVRYNSGDRVRMKKQYRASNCQEVIELPIGANLKAVKVKSDEVVAELPCGQAVPIPLSCCEVVPQVPNPRLEGAIQVAQRLIGTPYRWGGKTSAGIDCSGLVQLAFSAEGMNMPRDSNQQVYVGRLSATRWFRQGLRRGDTLYFMGARGRITHTALYLGDGQYLEAVRPHVRVSSFHPSDANYSEQRDAAFAFAKRLLD
jgi:hypothetical protein